jgi:AcrR family transcriptional regulator
MGELDTDRIAAAALAVADDRGVDGFTMRAVAETLGVTPMALYHHVADKAALVALVVDRVINEQPLPPPSGDWQEDLWQIACWFRHMASAHPNVSYLRRIHKVWTPTVLPVTERWFSIWQQSGLEFDAAMLAGSISSMAILGIVEEEQLFQVMDHPGDKMLDWLPNARMAFDRTPNRDREFELIVRSLVDGLHNRLARESEARQPAHRATGSV